MKTILFTLFSLMLMLNCHSAEQQIKYLDTLKINSFKSGWGKTQRNQNISNKPLTIDGKVYDRGLGTHAEFYGKVSLNKSASRFQAVVGVDDGSTGRVEFQIKLDGKTAWKSGIMNKGDSAKKVDLNLVGAESMELIVTDGDNSIGSDHANWCDAKFIYSGAAPTVSRYDPWKWITPKTELEKAKASLIPYPVSAEWSKGAHTASNFTIKTAKDGKYKNALESLKRFGQSSNISVKVGNKANVVLRIGKVKGHKSKEAYKSLSELGLLAEDPIS